MALQGSSTPVAGAEGGGVPPVLKQLLRRVPGSCLAGAVGRSRTARGRDTPSLRRLTTSTPSRPPPQVAGPEDIWSRLVRPGIAIATRRREPGSRRFRIGCPGSITRRLMQLLDQTVSVCNVRPSHYGGSDSSTAP